MGDWPGLANPRQDSCNWRRDDEGVAHTECGEAYSFEFPDWEQYVNYCQNCGGVVHVTNESVDECIGRNTKSPDTHTHQAQFQIPSLSTMACSWGNYSKTKGAASIQAMAIGHRQVTDDDLAAAIFNWEETKELEPHLQMAADTLASRCQGKVHIRFEAGPNDPPRVIDVYSPTDKWEPWEK